MNLFGFSLGIKFALSLRGALLLLHHRLVGNFELLKGGGVAALAALDDGLRGRRVDQTAGGEGEGGDSAACGDEAG